MKITLKTLPKATAQQVFNQVYRHLIKQGRRSKKKRGRGCLYRSPEGLQCAAGCLIGKKEYRPSFENEVWGTLCASKDVPSNHLELISKLQYVHDFCLPSKWKKELLMVANIYGLTIPKV